MKATLLFYFLCASTVVATPQAADRMEVNGETVFVHGFKLSAELQEQMQATRRQLFEAARAEGRSGLGISSANRDGFYATLVLEDQRLYLTELRLEAKEEDIKRGLHKVPLEGADEHAGSLRLFASWFSGGLKHYHGKRLGYTHERRNVKVFTFEEGMLVDVVESDVEAMRKTQSTRVKEGDVAPDFACTTLSGEKFVLSQQEGRVVLLNFFATWCGPCVRELPRLEEDVLQNYAPRTDFRLIVVGRGHEASDLEEFCDERGIALPMAPDPEKKIYALYAKSSIPRNFVIGKDGRVKLASIGYSEALFEEMLAAIETELDSAQPPSAADTQAAEQSAIRFNGMGQHVRVPNFFTNAPTTEVTVEFWQKTFGYRAQSSFSQDDSQRDGFDATNVFNAHVPYANGRVYWDFGNIRTEGRLSYVPSESILGTWQHFAFVASQSGNFMRIYRNGVLEAQRANMTPLAGGTFDLNIGGETYIPVSFGGVLDEFRIWKAARTQSEIQSTMYRSLTLPHPDLMAYWRFDEGEGEIAHDASGHGRDGILVNEPQWVYPDSNDLWNLEVRRSREQLCVNHMRNLYSAAVSYCLESGLGPDCRVSVADLEVYLTPCLTACPSGGTAYPAFSVLLGPLCSNGHAFEPGVARPLRASDPKTAGLYRKFGLTNLIDAIAEPGD